MTNKKNKTKLNSMDGITPSELARRACVTRGAITQARDAGLIVQDSDGTFDPDNPDIALYIQRGVERFEKKHNEFVSEPELSAPPLLDSESGDDKPDEPDEPEELKHENIPEESNESLFVSTIISVLDSELGNKKEKEIMQKIFEKYSGAI